MAKRKEISLERNFTVDLQLTKSTSSGILSHKGEIVEASIITANMAQAYVHVVIQYLSGVDGLEQCFLFQNSNKMFLGYFDP